MSHGHSGTSRGKEFLIPLLKCLTTLEYNEQLLSLVQAICAKPSRYPVLDTLAPVCEELYKSLKVGSRCNDPLQQLFSYCISSLEASPIPSPPERSKPIIPSCSCADCGTLVHFLRHQTEVQHRFRMVQAKRSHLQRQLQGNRSVTCTTERFGSPHTLIVTKTQEEIKYREYQKEREVLTKLKSLFGVSEPSTKRQKVITMIDLTET